MARVLFFLALLAFVASVSARKLRQKERNDPEPGKETAYTYRQVCYVDNVLKILNGFDCRNQVAVARYRNSVNSTGWTYLEVETRSNYPAELQAYAAGYLEGLLGKRVLDFHLNNTVQVYCKNFTGYCKRLDAFITENQKWIQGMLSNASVDDVYWQAVNRTYYQLSGLIDAHEGRDFNARITFEIHPVLYVNLNGDFYDLEKKLNKTRDPTDPTGHCSGFVKVAPNNSDIFISQVTMSGFQNMLRVLKLYKFGYDKKFYPGYGTAIASYPGMLYSSDDFALQTSGLAVIETTISVFNNSLYDKTKATGQLASWVRAIVANQLARSGREWSQIFSRFNSGTYNNQWVVLDYSVFKPYQELPDYGLLYVLEQMPGKIVYRDITWYLRKYSYFPSYNIPFTKKITEISGFIQQGKKLGTWFQWGKSPRAKIFDRDHHNVVDLESLRKLMRYNDYQHDEFSRCNCTPPYSAEAGISARGDLNPSDGKFEFPGMGHVNHGALDYKGTNYKLAKKLQFKAVGGPTWDQQPPFDWTKFDIKVPHFGHPDVWRFDQLDIKWETDVNVDF